MLKKILKSLDKFLFLRNSWEPSMEETDGCNCDGCFSLSMYNWPNNKKDLDTISLPLSCNYSPSKELPPNNILDYNCLRCNLCKSVLNPYCKIDFQNYTWHCPICYGANTFPSVYKQMKPENVSYELYPTSITVEYSSKNQITTERIYVFIIDTCTDPQSLDNLKKQILKSFSSLPEDAFVGLISYGTNVSLYELKFSQCPRNFAFGGTKTVDSNQLSLYLSVKPGSLNNKFLVRVSEAQTTFTTLVDTLEQDPYHVEKNCRPQRCTGVALHLGVNLIKAVLPGHISSIFLFNNGPITKSFGSMASISCIDRLRQLEDIDKGKAPLTESSIQFFKSVGSEACASNISINIFTSGFEEAGLYEMYYASSYTGGFLYSYETWNDVSFEKTLEKCFNHEFINQICHSAVTNVYTSPQIKVSGCIGSCLSLNKQSLNVSKNVIGEGNTNEWTASCILPGSTYTFYFDLTASRAEPVPVGSIGYIQIVTKYNHVASNTYRTRVTTFAVNFSNILDKNSIISSIDQYSLISSFTKLCTYISRTNGFTTAKKYINDTCISVGKNLYSYVKGQPKSFQPPEKLDKFIEFLYFFSKSHFISKSNCTPDSVSGMQLTLCSESIDNCLFIIKPSLICYNAYGQCASVDLDNSNLQKENVLVLDTFYRVLVWYGEAAASWRDNKYHEDEEYSNVKKLLEDPLKYAEDVVNSRFPTPEYTTCDQNSSLSRYLISLLNPSSYSTQTTEEQTYEDFYGYIASQVCREGAGFLSFFM